MKIKTFLLLTCWLISQRSHAQNVTVRDSLVQVLKKMPESQQDTVRVKLLHDIAFQFNLNKPDTTLLLAQQAFQLSKKIDYPSGVARALNVMAMGYVQLGDFAKALTIYNSAKEAYAKIGDQRGVIVTISNISDCYMQQGDWPQALKTMRESYQLFKNRNGSGFNATAEPIFLSNLGEDFYNLHQLDSASYYLNLALPLGKKYNSGALAVILYTLGDVAMAKLQNAQAKNYYREAVDVGIKDDNFTGLHESYFRMARMYQQSSQNDSAAHFAELALTYGQKASYPSGILKASQLLTKLYKDKNDTKALHYFEIATAAKDSLFSQDRLKQLLSYSFEEKQKQQEIETANAEYRNSIKNYIFGALLAVLAGIAFFFYRSNMRERKAKALLQKQKEEIDVQRSKAEKTLAELKSAQTQLIQSEKMASLGELTAGIAHEIQNPLNFVNNFSDVNTELLVELNQEIERENYDEIKVIAKDIADNEQKINHHGKRAEAIVKGMLQHSQANSGKKEPTDINALADEYLRLAYHGLRAKDKSFNAEMKTDFDENIGNINIIPQDIGRVLLNLYNNAFYTVAEKKKQAVKDLSGFKNLTGLNDYEPTVSVSTKKINGKVEIKVTDNGNGIPQKIVDKIFQPFFTTKPTGQGTGLGLSLSYDIIKAHGGEIKVNSKEGEGTVFTIAI